MVQWSELSGLAYMTMGAMCEIYSAELDGVKVVVKIPRKDCEVPSVAEHDLEVGGCDKVEFLLLTVFSFM